MDNHIDPQAPTHALSKTTRDYYDWLDMAIKTIALFGALVTAIMAVGAYRKDIDEKIVDQRIKAFDDALTEAGKVVLASDWQTFGQALDRFGVVKHGQILAAIGEGPVYDAAVDFYNVGVDIWTNSKYADPIPQGKMEQAFEDMAMKFSDVVGSPADFHRLHTASH